MTPACGAGAGSPADTRVARSRPSSCAPCPGAGRTPGRPPGCSCPRPSPPGGPVDTLSPDTSIPPPIGSTSTYGWRGTVQYSIAECQQFIRPTWPTLTPPITHVLLEQITDPLRQTLALLAIQTGLRRSEILGLHWRDINFASGALSVRRALIKLASGGTELKGPKNGHGRVVDLPADSVEALRAHRGRNPEPSRNGNFVFFLPFRWVASRPGPRKQGVSEGCRESRAGGTEAS